jgi:hypothetical protein
MPKIRFSGYILDVLSNSCGDSASKIDPKTGKPDMRHTSGNVLADRLPEIKDFPYSLKLSLMGPGSLAGDEDIIGRTEH